MAIQKKISVARAVEMAQVVTANESRNRLVPLFRVWAKEGEGKIGSFTQYRKKIFIIDINGCRAELPCCVVSITGVLLGDHGCECDLFFKRVYSYYSSYSKINISPNEAFTVIDTSSGDCTCSGVRWTIQNNSLVFASKYCSGKVTIEALCYEEDCDGYIMVNENHIDALAQYIKVQWMLRQKFKKGDIQFNQAEINFEVKEWHRKCANARAEDGELSESDRAEIVAMINDPLSGIQNAQWTGDSYSY